MQNEHLLYAEGGTLLHLDDLEKGKDVANVLVFLSCPSCRRNWPHLTTTFQAVVESEEVPPSLLLSRLNKPSSLSCSS